MVLTGIETAGLVLAVFPLVVSGLKSYADSVQTIKEMWHYRRTLKSFSRELAMEGCKFENTCRSLLEDMVSSSDLALLMKDPGGPLWSVSSLQEKLGSRLRPSTVPFFMEAIEALMSALQCLHNEIGVYNELELGDSAVLKKRLKGIAFVLSKPEYKDLLANIVKINSDLAILAGQCQATNSSPPLRATGHAKHYKRIRDNAINIYGVLKENLQATPACACTEPHCANLQLEMRSTTTQGGCDRDTSLRFHVAISFGGGLASERSLSWNWREMGLEPLDNGEEHWESNQAKEVNSSSNPNHKEDHVGIVPYLTVDANEMGNTMSYTTHQKPGRITRLLNTVLKPSRRISPTRPQKRPEYENKSKRPPRNVSFSLPPIRPEINNMNQINDLCLTIQQTKSELSCLGVLIDKSNRRYRVGPLRIPQSGSNSEQMGVLSLESLLSRPGALKRKDRLILGVQLASTVLQLHKTEWLSESWGKKDILFRQEINQGGIRGPANMRKPLVRQIFASPGTCLLPPSQGPPESILIPHNQSLYSLGIILVELWYGQCVEDLRGGVDENTVGDMADYVTAKRLIHEIHEEAGEKYGEAVRRCINGLDHKSTNLEIDDFKNEVYMKVVSPLVENLESFCGMELLKLL